jgi:hypothetical protein
MGEHFRVVASTTGQALKEVITDLVGWDENSTRPTELDVFVRAVDAYLVDTINGEVRVYNDNDEGTLYATISGRRQELKLAVDDPRSFILTKNTLVHGDRIKWRRQVLVAA